MMGIPKKRIRFGVSCRPWTLQSNTTLSGRRLIGNLLLTFQKGSLYSKNVV
jgi:hypothetical protein